MGHVHAAPVDPETDLDELYKVALACEAAEIDEPDTTRDDISSLLRSPDADLVDGTRKAVDAGGSIAGVVFVEVDEAGREVFADTYVSPEAPDETFDLLLGHAATYGEALVASRSAGERGRWILASGCYAGAARYSAALSRAGMTTVRRFHTMAVTFDPDEPPEWPPLHAEVTAEIVGRSEAGLRTAHEVWQESFTEHWRNVPRSYEDFMAWARVRSFNPDEWWLFFVAGEPAGVCIGNDHLADLGHGYVSILGVLKAFRRQGLGRLMLETFFAQAHTQGRVGVKLGVDVENGTGAPALYAAVGMTPVAVIDAWELPLD